MPAASHPKYMSLIYGIAIYTSITYKDAFGGFQIINSQHFVGTF